MKSNLFFTNHRFPYNHKLLKRAKKLRNNQTEPEKKMWYEVLKNIPNFRWTRQKIIDNYIVDFYCASLKLVIEVDGDSHFGKENEKYDSIRTNVLESLGITVIRYLNNEIMKNSEGVFSDLLEKIKKIEQK